MIYYYTTPAITLRTMRFRTQNISKYYIDGNNIVY